jgi:hypothetical protein
MIRHPHKPILDLDAGVSDEDEDRRRYPDRRAHADFTFADLARMVFPLLLAWGLAVWTARTEAHDTVAVEIAVVKATEQSHFEEIQRTLHRLDDWIVRNEQTNRGKQQP